MASLEIIYQQEEQLNAAVCSILASPQYDLAAFFAHDTREKPADRVEVKAELGAANGHVAQNGEWDSFSYTLELTVFTERQTDEPLPTRHALAKAKVRAALSVLRAEFNTGNLPYLQICSLIPNGTTVDFDNAQSKAMDITRLSYNGTVAILNTAWTA